MTQRCTQPGCGSYAINPGMHGRSDDDKHLCDVCYWRVRYNNSQADIDEAVRLLRDDIDAFKWVSKTTDDIDIMQSAQMAIGSIEATIAKHNQPRGNAAEG